MLEILSYSRKLKPYSRELRKNMTPCEQILWRKIRRKQIEGVQFYTQKPLGIYILDFYAKDPKLAIELDGDHHFGDRQQEIDINRDEYLSKQGIYVLRFSNSAVLERCSWVLSKIETTIQALRSHRNNNPL